MLNIFQKVIALLMALYYPVGMDSRVDLADVAYVVAEHNIEYGTDAAINRGVVFHVAPDGARFWYDNIVYFVAGYRLADLQWHDIVVRLVSSQLDRVYYGRASAMIFALQLERSNNFTINVSAIGKRVNKRDHHYSGFKSLHSPQRVGSDFNGSLTRLEGSPNQVDAYPAQRDPEYSGIPHYERPESDGTLAIKIILFTLAFACGLYCYGNAIRLGLSGSGEAGLPYMIVGIPAILLGMIGCGLTVL